MASRTKVMIAVMSFLVLVAAALLVFAWKDRAIDERSHLLALLPRDASAVVYVDIDDLRESAFLSALIALSPRPAADADYSHFVNESGFDFERDLDRVAIAIRTEGGKRTAFVAADGHFNRERIARFALRTGSKETQGGRVFYNMPASADGRPFSFAFSTAHQIVLSNDGALPSDLTATERDSRPAEWTTRFQRLAGSPAFALIRQDASAGQAVLRQAPGGFRSPQLASLIDQMEWLSVAIKPVGSQLQVVAEGESTSDETTRQLADFLNGALVLAEAGLADPKMRGQMDEDSRVAYLDLLKSADISRIDRSATKSVRLVFEVTPQILALAGKAAAENPTPPDDAASRKLPQKSSGAKKRD